MENEGAPIEKTIGTTPVAAPTVTPEQQNATTARVAANFGSQPTERKPQLAPFDAPDDVKLQAAMNLPVEAPQPAKKTGGFFGAIARAFGRQ